MSEAVSILPLVLVLLPTLGTGAVVLAARYGQHLRSQVTNFVMFATFVAACWQFYIVQQGTELVYALEGFMEFGLRWRVDFVGATFSVVVTLVWFLATVFARDYMAHEHHQTRFFAFWTFTLGGTVGVFVAGDLFSLFLFFEAMTFAAYVLVIHEQDRESMRAGNVYLYLSIAGGLALLGVIFLLQFVVGATGFEPALHLIVAKGISPWLILVMLIGGFGVKAGMLPLHIWLPKAHPVAPAPASAVLSAIMIKTGAYGFLRLLYVVLSVLMEVPCLSINRTSAIFSSDWGRYHVYWSHHGHPERFYEKGARLLEHQPNGLHSLCCGLRGITRFSGSLWFCRRLDAHD